MAKAYQNISAGISSPDVIIELSDGITIRRWRQSDIPSLTHYANNKKVWDTLRNRMPYPYTAEDCKSWIDRNSHTSTHIRSGAWTAENGSQGPAIPVKYAIAIDKQAVGSIGLEFGAVEDVYARTAELGYYIGAQFWGRGIMSKVVSAFVEWTWSTFEILVRLNACPYERNVASVRCLEKAGFQIEGLKKCGYVKNGIIGNELVMGAIRPGFET